MILAEGSQGLWRGLSDSAQLLAQPASSSFPARRPEQPCSSLAEPQAVSSPGAVAWLGDSRAVPSLQALENTLLSWEPLCQQPLAGAGSLAGCALHCRSSAPAREADSSPWLSQAVKSSGSALGQAICSLRMLCEQ